MEKLVNSTKITSTMIMEYKPNPKRPSGKAYARYEHYSQAQNIEEYFLLAADNDNTRYAMPDLRFDLAAGFIQLTDIDGNIIVSFGEDKPKKVVNSDTDIETSSEVNAEEEDF